MYERIRKRRISKATAQTNLYADDEKELQNIVSADGSKRSIILRSLVSEALYVRRLRKAGKDVVTSNVKSAQKEVLQSEFSPLIESIKSLEVSIEKDREDSNTFFNNLQNRIKAIEDMQELSLRLADATLVNILFLRGAFWWHLGIDYYKRIKGKTTEECKTIYKKLIDSLRPVVLKERGRYNEKVLEQAVEDARDEMTDFSFDKET